MRYRESLVGHAVLYVERFGFSVIPLGEEKRPSRSWSEYQDRYPRLGEILDWPMDNLAIVTGAISDIVVVDCESREDATWFMKNRARKSDKPAVVKTKRGYHLYYRHPGERIRNAQKVDTRYDVRGDGGYVVGPPSRHSEGSYRWVRPVERVRYLPEFDPAWRPEHTTPRDEKIVHDAVKYIHSIHAVSGDGGHDDTYRAARTLRESGMDEAEALLELQQWNETNAHPPWSQREILHKIREAYR